MDSGRDRRRFSRQYVMLPLRVMEKEPTGRLLFQGDTVNVGAGGLYFKTLNWQDLQVGAPVHVVIDIPPEMFQLLPFGGLRGSGEILRIEGPTPLSASGRPTCGVAVRMTTRLKFDPELHLPQFDAPAPHSAPRPQTTD
jgi:hypothetical protein